MIQRLAVVILAAAAFGAVSAQDTIRIGLSLGPASLSPAESTGLPDATVIRHIFEGLVGFDANNEIIGELATSWTANDDATEYVFTLREGVTFQDGTPFNAEAAEAYYAWVLDPDSAGARGRTQLAGVNSITATGDFELTFSLDEPNGALLFNLALSNSRIASPASIEASGSEAGRNPVGTGPFRLASWQDGVSVTLERFDDYWGEPARADTLVFLEVPNASTRVAMLQSGEADYIENVAPQLTAQIEGTQGLSLITGVGTSSRILQLNTTKAPFDDIRVRQALNHAVDVEQVIRVALQGFGVPLTAPMPEPIFGHSPQPDYTYDPELARELLAEAGYEDGFDVTVLTFVGDEYNLAGQMLQQYFAAVGVNMTLDARERGSLVDQIFLPADQNPTEAALVGQSVATGDADRGLVPSFATWSQPPASNNWSFYDNPRVDELLRAGIRTADPQERLAIYEEAQALIWADAPWVFIYSATNLAATRDDVHGIIQKPERTLDARGAWRD